MNMLTYMIRIAPQNTQYKNVIHICKKLEQTLSMLQLKREIIFPQVHFSRPTTNSPAFLTLLRFPDSAKCPRQNWNPIISRAAGLETAWRRFVSKGQLSLVMTKFQSGIYSVPVENLLFLSGICWVSFKYLISICHVSLRYLFSTDGVPLKYPFNICWVSLKSLFSFWWALFSTHQIPINKYFS